VRREIIQFLSLILIVIDLANVEGLLAPGMGPIAKGEILLRVAGGSTVAAPSQSLLQPLHLLTIYIIT
jgi:hypothetical protein